MERIKKTRNMNDLQKKYNERTIRWHDKSLSQLSFFNNLLLTLSVAFLSFGFDYKTLPEIHCAFKGIDLNWTEFTQAFKSINWELTLITVSQTLILLSIIVGLIVAINRLYDFRITSQINLIRYRVWKHSGEKLDEKTPDTYKSAKRTLLTFKVLMEKYPKITIEECKNLTTKNIADMNNVKNSFRELRNIVHNLGVDTWTKMKWQTSLFILSILLFVLAEFNK